LSNTDKIEAQITAKTRNTNNILLYTNYIACLPHQQLTAVTVTRTNEASYSAIVTQNPLQTVDDIGL